MLNKTIDEPVCVSVVQHPGVLYYFLFIILLLSYTCSQFSAEQKTANKCVKVKELSTSSVCVLWILIMGDKLLPFSNYNMQMYNFL
jgi:hypothetical protein